MGNDMAPTRECGVDVSRSCWTIIARCPAASPAGPQLALLMDGVIQHKSADHRYALSTNTRRRCSPHLTSIAIHSSVVLTLPYRYRLCQISQPFAGITHVADVVHVSVSANDKSYVEELGLKQLPPSLPPTPCQEQPYHTITLVGPPSA